MDASKVKDWLKLFAKVGIVYHKREVESWWNTFPNHGSDASESIRIFLLGYAFERQGAPSSYPPIAGEALKQAMSSPLDPNEVWELFKKESGGMGLNEARHPLAPQGTEYKTKSGNSKKTEQKSVIEFANGIRIPLIEWVHEGLEMNTEPIFRGLCEISGIGPKIASYFMRDVACQFNRFPFDVSNRHLLQPIDIWTRRAAESLSANKFPDYDPVPAAKFIVNESLNSDLSPERVNQGMWYFGAEIAGTDYYLNRLFFDSDGLKRASDDLLEHLQFLQAAASSLDKFDPPPCA